jgi:DNA-binding HxlR family transcriptional regulator
MSKLITGEEITPYRCPVTATVNLIGGKWKLIILWCISNDINHFGQLQCAIPGISKKMLTSELRALEADGILSRTVYPVVPPKVEYNITELGATLRPLLNSIAGWGETYALPLQKAAQSEVAEVDR